VLESQSEFEVSGEAENGKNAIDRAQQLKPDLIVLDLSMPNMNGFEAARRLRTLMPRVPILMYTSLMNAYLAEEAESAGVSAVIDKAEPAKVLLARVRSLLQNTA